MRKRVQGDRLNNAVNVRGEEFPTLKFLAQHFPQERGEYGLLVAAVKTMCDSLALRRSLDWLTILRPNGPRWLIQRLRWARRFAPPE